MIKVIKASCGVGKTSKAIDIAIELASSGKNVVLLNNEETQESIIGRIMDIQTDFGTGDLSVGEIDGFRLVDLQDSIDAACRAGSRKIDVFVIDFNGYTEFNASNQSMLIKLRDYLKRIEVVHNVDIYFTMNVMRKTKAVGKVSVAEVWKDTKYTKAKIDADGVVSIDVTNASPMIRERGQVCIYQTMNGEYIGKYVDFKYYGFKA